MVIDERDGAVNFLTAEFLTVLDEMIADHVRDGQRAVVITLLPDISSSCRKSDGGRDTLKRLTFSFFMATAMNITKPFAT